MKKWENLEDVLKHISLIDGQQITEYHIRYNPPEKEEKKGTWSLRIRKIEPFTMNKVQKWYWIGEGRLEAEG